jgi:hypothetical protein
MAGALSMDERLNAAAEQQVVLRFSYMALLMGKYGDAPLDFWGQGSGAVPTAAASGLALLATPQCRCSSSRQCWTSCWQARTRKRCWVAAGGNEGRLKPQGHCGCVKFGKSEQNVFSKHRETQLEICRHSTPIS